MDNFQSTGTSPDASKFVLSVCVLNQQGLRGEVGSALKTVSFRSRVRIPIGPKFIKLVWMSNSNSKLINYCKILTMSRTNERSHWTQKENVGVLRGRKYLQTIYQ